MVCWMVKNEAVDRMQVFAQLRAGLLFEDVPDDDGGIGGGGGEEMEGGREDEEGGDAGVMADGRGRGIRGRGI